MTESHTPLTQELLGKFRDGEQQVRNEALRLFDRGDLLGAAAALGRNEAVPWFFLRHSEKRLDAAQLRLVILHLWQMAEFPCRYLSKADWLNWFGRSGFLSDTDRLAPTRPIEVWRSQVGRTIGLSWTEDREKAIWFHERNRDGFGLRNARVLHGFAPPKQVLAFINAPDSRHESEVIVDTTRRFWTVESETCLRLSADTSLAPRLKQSPANKAIDGGHRE